MIYQLDMLTGELLPRDLSPLRPPAEAAPPRMRRRRKHRLPSGLAQLPLFPADSSATESSTV